MSFNPTYCKVVSPLSVAAGGSKLRLVLGSLQAQFVSGLAYIPHRRLQSVMAYVTAVSGGIKVRFKIGLSSLPTFLEVGRQD